MNIYANKRGIKENILNFCDYHVLLDFHRFYELIVSEQLFLAP